MENPFSVFIGLDGTEYEVEDTWVRDWIKKLTPEKIGAMANNPYKNGGTAGEKGYVAVAQLKITGSYANRPIEFELISRGRGTPCYVSVCFNNDSGEDPSLSKLTYSGTDYSVFLHKTATSTWILYAAKSEAYDEVTVARLQAASQGITITYPSGFLAAKPTSNVTNAVLGGNVGYAASAAKLATQRSIRTNLGSTSAASFDGSANITPGVTGTLPIANGGTGATTASQALSNLGGFPKSGGSIPYIDVVNSTPAYGLKNKTGTKIGIVKMFDSGMMQLMSSDMKDGKWLDENNAGIEIYPRDNTNIHNGIVYRSLDTYYALYGTHNLTKGNWDVAAGTSGWSDGYIYLQYE